MNNGLIGEMMYIYHMVRLYARTTVYRAFKQVNLCTYIRIQRTFEFKIFDPECCIEIFKNMYIYIFAIAK